MKLEVYETQTPIEVMLAIDEQGMTSAKKVYRFLKLEVAHYARWCKNNIVDNKFAIEGEDWEYSSSKVSENKRGNFSKDYKLTANFAKKICMKAGGERGEQAQNYFAELGRNCSAKADELIPVQYSEDGDIAVSGRELHQFLEVKTRYNDWIKSKVEKYEFVENTDYVTITEKSVKPASGGRPGVDHALTVSTAKELAMVESNDKGKQARKYFIEVEKKFKQEVQQTVEPPAPSNELSVEHKMRVLELIVNCPEHAIDTFSELAKTFIQEDIQKPPLEHVKTAVSTSEPAKKTRKRRASPHGHKTPFKREKLRRYLLSRSITRQEFSRLSGVPKSVVDATLDGKTRPGFETRHKICKALGKSPDWLNG